MTAVLDIECARWDTYVTGALSIDGDTFVTRDPDELLDAVLSHEGEIWAHNGGRYDWQWLLEQLSHRHGAKANIWLSGSAATCIKIGKTMLRDSYRLIPMGLGKAAAIAGMQKSETGFDCDCGRDCGGYCHIDESMPESDYRLLEQYLVQDCDVLRGVLDTVGEFAAEHEIALKGTVGSSAWHTAKRWADLPDARWNPSHYKSARAGYYGGRTEVARMHAPEIKRYDIHSCYPAALTQTALPMGAPRLFARDYARRKFDSGAPGIYRLTIDIPEMLAPPLPIRTGERNLYPWGRITGEWTLHEIEHAIECGATPVEFAWSLVWERTEAVLSPVARRIWDMRDKAAREGKSALAAWLKWLANSLTGKLAQDPEGRTLVMDLDGRAKCCPGGKCDGRCSPGRCCDHTCTGRCGRWDAIDPRGRLWARPSWRMPSCGHVQWAAYLTSAARVELHEQILHAGDAWVYCDTDSVYAMRELFRRLGEDLGEWGFEGNGIDWRAIAPKAYYYLEPETERPVCFIGDDGESWQERVKCKGLSRLTPETWQQYAAGKPVTIDTGVEGLLSAARAGRSLFGRRELTRKSNSKDSEWCGGRIRNGDGSTRAPKIEDLAA